MATTGVEATEIAAALKKLVAAAAEESCGLRVFFALVAAAYRTDQPHRQWVDQRETGLARC